MFGKILEIASQVVCIAAIAVIAVERDGDGTQKREESLEALKQFKTKALESGLFKPGRWLDIFFSDFVLGWVVDSLVATANKQGLFGKVETISLFRNSVRLKNPVSKRIFFQSARSENSRFGRKNRIDIHICYHRKAVVVWLWNF